MSDQANQEDVESFVSLLGRHYSSVYGYVITLVAKPADADDIMQETCIALWRKFSDFDPDRNFRSWAFGIARIEVLRYRQKMARSKLWFSEEVLETLSEEVEEPQAEADARHAALAKCLNSLSESDRSIIRSRYDKDQSVREISMALKRPESTVYKMLLRIRSSLADCIQARLFQEYHLKG